MRRSVRGCAGDCRPWLNPSRSPIPLGTLAANLIGAYVVGIALGWITYRPGIAPEWRLFLVTGLLGGLTTFSTFSAEIVQHLTRQQYGTAVLGVAAHLFGSLLLTTPWAFIPTACCAWALEAGPTYR